MNWRIVGAVLRKELKETLRDRRTLMIMIVVPVLLYPAMLIAVEQIALFGRRTLETGGVTVAVEARSDFVGVLETDARMRVVRARSTDAMAALRRGSIDLVVVEAEGGADGATYNVDIFFDAASERSAFARERVRQHFQALSETLLAERLREQGLPSSFATPIAVRDMSVASPRDMGGYMLGRFLPLLLILMTVLGAFYPSIDLAAGEKERGTLEALMTAPVPADHLVTGKFLAAAIMGLTAATLNLGSMLLTFQAGVLGIVESADVQFRLPVQSALLIFGVLALLAVLFSALFLGIAVRSHSFKEAQNSLTPVYILSLVPAMLPMMPGTAFTMGFALVPVAGVGFLFRELMSGSAPLAPSILTVAATALYAALALIFAARAFGREDILFGTGTAERRERVPATGAPVLVPYPQASAALGLVAAAALLFFYGARGITMSLGVRGVLLSQWLFLTGPVLLLLRAGRYSAVTALGLTRPPARALAGALLLIAGGIPIGWLIAWLQGFVIEIPSEYLESMAGFMSADSLPAMLWLLLVLAITPAICEELVFRGIVLQSFGTRFGAATAIGVSAVLFGAFHLSFETAIRFLPTLWLGILLGYAVWKSRSILVGMVMHLVNNTFVLLLLWLPALRELMGAGDRPPVLLLLIAPVLVLAGRRLLMHERVPASAV